MEWVAAIIGPDEMIEIVLKAMLDEARKRNLPLDIHSPEFTDETAQRYHQVVETIGPTLANSAVVSVDGLTKVISMAFDSTFGTSNN